MLPLPSVVSSVNISDHLHLDVEPKTYLYYFSPSLANAPNSSIHRPPETKLEHIFTQRLARSIVDNLRSASVTFDERREYLGTVDGLLVSESTVSPMLRRLDFGRKSSLGARERDEFLRAAWRTPVAEEFDAGRLVYLMTRWSPTSRFLAFI